MQASSNLETALPRMPSPSVTTVGIDSEFAPGLDRVRFPTTAAERCTAKIPWTHVEWGAANYGSALQDREDRFVPSKEQHERLFSFLQSHIQAHGTAGVLYLNDLEPGPVAEVAAAVRTYLKEHGYDQIKVIEYPGDYTKVPVPESDTARISHPQSSFFNEPGLLNRLSARSVSGLEVLTHYNAKLDELLAADERMHAVCLGKAKPYLFPSGREVRYRPVQWGTTRRWLVSSDALTLLSSATESTEMTLKPGATLFNWATERRFERLLQGASDVPFARDVFSRLHSRSVSLLGPGFYCSQDPFEFVGYGKKLLAVTFTQAARFWAIPNHQLGKFDSLARQLGYRDGINSVELRADLSKAGYAGLLTHNTGSGYRKNQLVMIGPVPGAHLRDGADYLSSLDPSAVLERKDPSRYVQAMNSLNLREQSAAVLELAEERKFPLEAVLADSRTFMQKLSPILDRIGTGVFGSGWRAASDKASRFILALTHAADPGGKPRNGASHSHLIDSLPRTWEPSVP